MKRFLFLISIIFYFFNNTKGKSDINKKGDYKVLCGVDKKKSKVQTYNLSEEQKEYIFQHNRKLEDNNGPINIYLCSITFKMAVQLAGLNYARIEKLLNSTIKDIQKFVNIKHLNYPIKVEYQFLEDNVICLSEAACDRDLLNPGVFYDLVILLKMDTINEFMTSENNFIDSTTNRTIVSILGIPSKLINMVGTNDEQYLKILLLHQFTHILGFESNTFQYFPGGIENTIKTQIDSRGINRTYIITPKVVQLAKKYYNCDNLIGLELEDQEEGHISSHWEARILLGEYMNSVLYNPEVVISEFTLALLEDSGWYTVNYYTGGLMRFGKNKGCNFLNNDCCDNQGNTLFKNEFFDLVDNENPSCSSGRLSRTYNLYNLYNSFTNDKYKRITRDQRIGGFTKNADYCFGFTYSDTEETSSNLFVGNCKIGSTSYGSKISFYDGSHFSDFSISNQELAESFSNHSFCILSEVFPRGSTTEQGRIYYEKYTAIIHPICYEMFCSNNHLTIKIKDQYVVCPRKGGRVEINGDFRGYIYCPDYNLICTGTIMCNDLFDCLDKKSLPKNAIYEYEFINEKTSSQKISNIKNEPEVFGYESNDEGICPEYCGQCRDIKRCFKCLEGYTLLGVKENDNLPIICNKTVNTSVGYFVKDNVYYPCIQYCNICNSSFTCIKCDNIHKTNDDRTECIDKVANCETYENVGFTCVKCKGEYVFIGDDRDNCYIINDKEKYYTLDNGISYYPCNHSISNCEICNNNKDICSKCHENYYFIKNNRTFCFNNYNLSKYYTNDTGISYYFCNDSIPFCDTCNNGITCETCGYNHYFIKDNRTHCVTGYNLNKYYTEDNGISYYPCNETINHCDECTSRSNCLKCEDSYSFIGDDRSLCRNDFNKSKYYTEDNGISYYPCYTNFEYCDECINKYTCTKCINQYGFIGSDKSKCHYIGSNEYYTDDGGITYKPCNTNLPNCQNCLNKTHCLKCNETYYFIAYDRTGCFSIYNLDEYFTEDNGISYFPCNTGIQHCKKCKERISCNMCEATYYFIANDRYHCVNDRNLMEYYTLDEGISYFPCHEAMENCKNCIVPTICMECQENTYFLRNDTSKCLRLNLKGYYKEGIFYYPCSDSMTYCSECYNKHFCSKCNINYYLKFEIHDVCYDLATFQNDKTYYKLNETHYKKCSSSISNCLYCNSGDACIECENDYYFLDDNYQSCININQLVPTDEFYKIDDKNYYSCGYRKMVENCLKCTSATFCLLCKNGYAFVSDNFNKCYSKDDLQIGYYHNKEETIYYPCIANCDYCNNGIECEKCSLNNDLIFDKTICDACQTNIYFINGELNLDLIHSLLDEYFIDSKNILTLIKHYRNENTNYSITIFHSWECTKYLFSQGYFSLDLNNIAKSIIKRNGDPLSSLTYVFVNYGKNKNYIEIYNSREKLIILKQICPECLENEFLIKNNLTNFIVNKFGKEITNNIIINNINVFNETDPTFSNFCSNFTIENIDIPLKERRDMLFLGDQAKELICLEPTCEIENINISLLSGTCQCQINSELTRLLEEENTEKSFNKVGINNFPIFTCYKEGFTNNLSVNVGLYLGIAFIVIQILLFVLYITSSKTVNKNKIPANPPNPNPTFSTVNSNSEMLFLENFDEIIKENGININKENVEMNYQDKDDLSEECDEADDEDLENKKTIDYLLSTEGAMSHRGKRNNDRLKDKIMGDFDTYSVKIHSEKKKNEKLLLKSSDENSSSLNNSKTHNKTYKFPKKSEVSSKSSFESVDGFNVKDIQRKNNSTKVCNTLYEAKMHKKTSFCEFYCLILGLRQPIINLFFSSKYVLLGDDYVPFSIKMIRFIFFISLNIFMNTLHLNHKYFYKKFEYFDNIYNIKNIDIEKISSTEIFTYAFINSVVYGFVSFMFCYIVQELINRYILNNRIDMDDLISSKNGQVTNEEIRELLRRPRIKYIIVVSLNFAFMIMFYFYIVNFFAVYRGGIIDYLASATWTFIFMQVIPFIICLIFAIFRYVGIKKSNHKLYKIGQLLIY